MGTQKRKIDWKLIGLILGWLLLIIEAAILFNAKKVNEYLNSNNEILHADQKVLANKIGTLTSQVGTYQVSEDQLQSEIISKDERLKVLTKDFHKVSSLLRLTASASIDSASVKFEHPIVCEHKTGDSIAPFTREGSLQKDWLCFDYNFNNNGFDIYNATANIDIVAATGFKRKWFLGRDYATTEVTPMQKNVVLANVSSYQVKVPVKWYQTRLASVLFGFVLCELKNTL